MIEKIRPVRLFIFDVDGVLTDGRIIYNDSGQETKFFDVRDGHGIKLLMRAGIEVGILSARESNVVKYRADNLGIELVYLGRKDKLSAFEEILKSKSITPKEIAYMGDDIIDLPVIKRVGFSATVADGVDEVKAMADYVAAKKGGRGAVREVAEVVLKAKGKWDEIMSHYLR
ncbi:MAG: HAD-IIIA family hydrolase [Deltaproteobacteria bacterium]|nr:HAD-IIIA family hydrolase [Deltaproteobacteria bacterium]